jgi:hypothetical protein
MRRRHAPAQAWGSPTDEIDRRVRSTHFSLQVQGLCAAKNNVCGGRSSSAHSV